MPKRRRYIGGGFCQDDFKSQRARTKPPKALLIVTEGCVSEPTYFKALKDTWNVHPKVLCVTPGGEGIPANLVKRADAELKDLKWRSKKGQLGYNELDRFDEVWIVFDTEHAQRQGRLTDGIVAAEEKGFHLAHSSPCFEFWLALHFSAQAPPMNSCDEAIRHLESAGNLQRGSYSKASGPAGELMRILIDKVPDAVRNANIVTGNQQHEDFPANPSTRVHELIRSIHETLPAAMKERFPID